MQAQKRKPKRQAIPEAIERVVRVIEPTIENLSDMVRIGEDVKEVPHYKPGTLWVERIIRPIYRLKVQPRFVIDNNPVENSIRPMAIGRKNYLFCENHWAARDAAMYYTFFGCCKLANVNQTDWLTYVLDNINQTKINEIQKLFPENWSASIQKHPETLKRKLFLMFLDVLFIKVGFYRMLTL